MTGTTPEDWFSIFLIGAPSSLKLLSSSATPPPRFESCSAELMDLPMDSMESSILKRKQLTSSPRCFLPALRKVGVAGWNLPVMISSTRDVVVFSLPAPRKSAVIVTRSSNRSR